MKIFNMLIFLMGVQSISAQSHNDFRKEIKTELNDILSYWEKNSVDIEKGGFYGAVDANNVPNLQADKHLITSILIFGTLKTKVLIGP
jgi:hypothetical protein